VAQIEALFDRLQNQRRTLRRIAAALVVSGILGIIAGAIAGIPVIIGLSVVDIIAGIVLLVRSFLVGRKLLNNRARLELMRELSGYIAQDADPNALYAVRLALHSKPRLLSQQPWTGRKRGKQQFLQESWMTLEGDLIDGCNVSAGIIELIRNRSFTNPRGKWKTKIRKRYLVTMKFSYPRERYGDARQAHQALNEGIRLPSSATIRGVRVTEKAITLKALVNWHDEIAKTARMLGMAAYRRFNLAQRAAASQRGGAR
jgi:hypothetical protein